MHDDDGSIRRPSANNDGTTTAFFWFFFEKKLHYLISSNDDYVSVGRVLDAATRSMHTQCAEAGVGMDDVCVVVLL